MGTSPPTAAPAPPYGRTPTEVLSATYLPSKGPYPSPRGARPSRSSEGVAAGDGKLGGEEPMPDDHREGQW